MAETNTIVLPTAGGDADADVASAADLDYWNALIDEKAAADFLDVTPRTMQALRQHGGGPRFVRLSARCVKYTRNLLRAHAEARLRSSTSDTGAEAA